MNRLPPDLSRIAAQCRFLDHLLHVAPAACFVAVVALWAAITVISQSRKASFWTATVEVALGLLGFYAAARMEEWTRTHGGWHGYDSTVLDSAWNVLIHCVYAGIGLPAAALFLGTSIWRASRGDGLRFVVAALAGGLLCLGFGFATALLDMHLIFG